jgi:hypothetical protein
MKPPFPYLIDSPEEGYVEAHGWLERDLAELPDKAEREFVKLYEEASGPVSDLGEGARFRCIGTEHLKATLDVGDIEEDEEVVHLVGEAAEKCAVESHREDELRYQRCEPDDDGARQWWKIDLVFEGDVV